MIWRDFPGKVMRKVLVVQRTSSGVKCSRDEELNYANSVWGVCEINQVNMTSGKEISNSGTHPAWWFHLRIHQQIYKNKNLVNEWTQPVQMQRERELMDREQTFKKRNSYLDYRATQGRLKKKKSWEKNTTVLNSR